MRGRYRYICVDEFQDTNHAQWELVRLIAEPHHNVTVVGDDDQSIYRFRGAALGNILGFREAYPRSASVVLVDNFRSRQPILDAAHRLIRHNDPDRLEAREGLDKRLKARSRFTRAEPADGAISLTGYTTGSDEADGVADRIAASIRSGRLAGQHAILVRGNRDADAYLRALNVAPHPVALQRHRRAVPAAGGARAHQLPARGQRSRRLGEPVRPGHERDLRSGARRRDPRAHASAPSIASSLGVALREAADQPESSPFGVRALEVVQRLIGTLDAHRAMSTERSCGELLYHFVTTSGWLGRLAAEARETGDERLANVGRFFEIVRRQGGLLRDDRLPFLVAQLDTLIETGDDPSTADAEPDEGDAVHVLTYHKAKGLEFDVVHLVGIVSDRFPGWDRPDPLEMPAELIADRPVEGGDQHVAEERRLFYVGMTRAREELALSWAQDYGGRRSRAVSQFVAEALDLPPATSPETVKPAVLERLARHEVSPRDRAPATRPVPADRPLNLSYGQISDYLDCPARYRYAHVVRLPTPVTHQMVYGRALHAAVQAIHRRQVSGTPLPLEGAHAALDAAWESVGFLTREHEEARLAAAHAAVERFWEAQQRDPARPVAVESDFTVSLRSGSAARTLRPRRPRRVGARHDHRLQVQRRRRPGHGQPPLPRVAPAVDLRPRPRGRDRIAARRAGPPLPRDRDRRSELAQREAAGRRPGEAVGGRHRHPRRPVRRRALAHALRLLPVPRDLPRRLAMTGRHRAILVALFLLGILATLALVAFAANACPAETEAQPCPDAGRNLVIGVLLAALALGLVVTPFAFIGEFVARRRIVYRGAWARAARRGVIVAIVVAVLAGLRLAGVLGVATALFVVVVAVAIEWLFARD